MEVDYVRVFQNQPTAVDEAKNDGIRITQDASTNDIILRMNTFAPGHYSIYDVAGKEQAVGEITQASQRINLSQVTNGIYLLQVRLASGASTFRLVKR